jgi:hypothetical protein
LALTFSTSFEIITFIVQKFLVFSEFWVRGFTTRTDREHLKISLLEFESGCARGPFPAALYDCISEGVSLQQLT